MYPHRTTLSLILALSLAVPAFGQNTLQPDLTALAANNTLARHLDLRLLATELLPLQNQNATPLDDGTRRGLHFDAQPGEGVIWIPNVDLADGIIEVDVRGRNEPGRSFVGIAFHGANNVTYEGIYLRPFNFRAENAASRSHSVQYISLPDNTWNVLRQAYPGRYEAALDPAPDPEGWVHLRVVLAGPQASVYVDGAERPVLTVDRIGNLNRGRVGLWLGNNSEGDFANLRITPQ